MSDRRQILPTALPSGLFPGPEWEMVEDSIWKPKTHPAVAQTARRVAQTLTDQPRWLEPAWLYDTRGSELFDRICELPEYYLTRTEEAILSAHAVRLVNEAPVEILVELGAGFARKSHYVLAEMLRARGGGCYVPVDVSLAALRGSRVSLVERFPGLGFLGLCARYEEGLAAVKALTPKLVAFLGSTVGNLTRSEYLEFFHALSDTLQPGDYFLLGADLLKDVALLEQAYADSQGLTAEFILNAFEHVNREAGTSFRPREMRYHSTFNASWQQMEMYAVATARQPVVFRSQDLSLVLEEGDSILVEISRKFEAQRLEQQLRVFGLEPVSHLSDPRRWFSVLLSRRQ